MSKPDGGPAFPEPERTHGHGWNGMTLRDYFAGQALAGLVAHDILEDHDDPDLMWEYTSGTFAIRAYELADAMLEERDR